MGIVCVFGGGGKSLYAPNLALAGPTSADGHSHARLLLGEDAFASSWSDHVLTRPDLCVTDWRLSRSRGNSWSSGSVQGNTWRQAVLQYRGWQVLLLLLRLELSVGRCG